MKPTLVAMLAGTALAAVTGTARAQAIYSLEVHDGDNAGLAYAYEDARRNNNEQLGAGMEHARCNVLANAPGGMRILCVGTASYTDIPGSPVNDRVQALCTSHRFDPVMGLVQTGIRYITNNNSNEEQNGHSPGVVPVFGGTAAAVLYNYDPDNNTRLYGQILGPDCETLKGQTQLFAQQNDNVLGMATNPINLVDGADDSRIGMCGIGNGNGRDDAWCLGIRARKQGTSYVLERYMAVNYEQEEERSRGAVNAVSIPDHLFVCAAVGNTQPPNRGVRCSLINTTPGMPDSSRVVWRKYIQKRQDNIYATTPAVAPILGPDGAAGDTFLVTYVEVDTSGRDGREKGATRLKSAMVKVGLDDLEILETPKYDRVGFGDQAHQNACGGYWGPDATPAAFIIQGSIVGSVTGAGKLSVLAYDAVNRTHDMIEELVYVDSSDTGWISQYYGNNPNTPQGRNHQFCMMVRNPGYGLQGGFQAEVEQFLFIANTGRKLRDNGEPQDKLAFDLVLVPAVIPSAGEPDPTPDPDPTPEPEPEPEPEEPGAQVGGCAAGGGSSGGLLLLLALAAVARRRRAA